MLIILLNTNNNNIKIPLLTTELLKDINFVEKDNAPTAIAKMINCNPNNFKIRSIISGRETFFLVKKNMIALSKDTPTNKIKKEASVRNNENIPFPATPRFLAISNPIMNCRSCKKILENISFFMINLKMDYGFKNYLIN